MSAELLRVVVRDDGYHLQRRAEESAPWETLVIFEGDDDETRQRAEEALFAEINATSDLLATEDLPKISLV